MKTGYPDLPLEDLREYIATGCTEIFIPYVIMCNSYCAIMNVPKIVELTIHNGRCALTGQQIGPRTGNAEEFVSFGQFRKAYERQLDFWLREACKSVKTQMDAQAGFSYSPLSSALLEGPIEKGRDICEGGCWYTTYGMWFAGIGQAADAQAAFIMDSWCDAIENMNADQSLIPNAGGKYICSSIVATSPTGLGLNVGALPGGRKSETPLSDTNSPEHGRDRQGPSAVICSNARLPQARNAMGNCLNQRLSPQMPETEEDIEKFVNFVETARDLGLAEIQFNVISSKVLRKAMKEPWNYRDLLVRTASYSAYFVDMNENCQLDIIDRTEQTEW